MPMFVTITRWKPETFRALVERWRTMIEGTAPKEVLEAFGKYKNFKSFVSVENRLIIDTFEVDDLKTSNIASYYLSDVCEMEIYPVIPLEEAWSVIESIPLEKIPKPEPWWKT